MRNYNANQQRFDSAPGTELYPDLGSITVQDTSGKSYYHSLQTQYERLFTKGFQFLGSFTWSKTIDDAFGNLDVCAPPLYSNYAIERGLSNQDQPYRLVMSALYELPFGRGKRWSGDVPKWADYIIGGCQLNGIYTLQGGLPFSITVNGNPTPTRADIVGAPHVSPGNVTSYVSAAAFAPPPATIYSTTTGAVNGVVFNAPGTSGRDILLGPGSSNIANPNGNLGNYTTGCAAGVTSCLGSAVLTFNPNAQFGLVNNIELFSWRQMKLGLRFTF